MLLGHYGAALALKRWEPKVSLGVLFVAVQLVDLLWAVFVLFGWEEARIVPGYTAASQLQFVYYPLTHSLVAGLIWALVAAGVYYSWPTRDIARHWQTAALVGLAVVSHYFLDVLVHLPDLPLASDRSPKLGLGLWNSVAATIAVEVAIFAAGIAVYVARRTRRHPVHPWRLAILVAVLLLVLLANVVAPPPPSMEVVSVSALVLYFVLAFLAIWVDRPAPPRA